MLVFRAVCLLALAALLLGSAPVTASDPLRLAKKNVRDVKLGSVVPANKKASGSSGSGLRQLLSAALPRAEVAVTDTADTTLTAEYLATYPLVKGECKGRQLVVVLVFTALMGNAQEDIYLADRGHGKMQ